MQLEQKGSQGNKTGKGGGECFLWAEHGVHEGGSRYSSS